MATFAASLDLPAPFIAVGEHIGVELPGGRALFTTRRGGVSPPPYDGLNLGLLTGDDADAVSANRELLAMLTGHARARTMQGRQVHGCEVRRVRELPDPAAEPHAADGLATTLDGVAAVVLTADCLPVALVAREAVAIVHAGWRGLAADVLVAAVAALRELGAEGDIQAAIGPGAGACCYGVGSEVRRAFAGYARATRRSDHIDLKQIARQQLEHAGVGVVHDVDICTICAAPGLFYSHRRERERSGRQAGVVWRVGEGLDVPAGAWPS